MAPRDSPPCTMRAELTVVQEPQTAQSSAMVLSALERRPADLVLDSAGIAELLQRLFPSAPRRRA